MRCGERLYGPGDDESAAVFTSRSPKGNRQMRRILNQCANAAVRTKGSIFEIVYRRLGHKSDRRRNYQSPLSADLDKLAPEGSATRNAARLSAT
jgi:hypothetical protein